MIHKNESDFDLISALGFRNKNIIMANMMKRKGRQKQRRKEGVYNCLILERF